MWDSSGYFFFIEILVILGTTFLEIYDSLFQRLELSEGKVKLARTSTAAAVIYSGPLLVRGGERQSGRRWWAPDNFTLSFSTPSSPSQFSALLTCSHLSQVQHQTHSCKFTTTNTKICQRLFHQPFTWLLRVHQQKGSLVILLPFLTFSSPAPPTIV